MAVRKGERLSQGPSAGGADDSPRRNLPPRPALIPSRGSGRRRAAPGALVDLQPLKCAVARMPQGSPLRTVVLEEPDSLPRGEYAAKAVVWFRLLRILQE